MSLAGAVSPEWGDGLEPVCLIGRLPRPLDLSEFRDAPTS